MATPRPYVVLLLLFVLTTACTSGKKAADGEDSVLAEQRPLPDTLRVATLYSPTSYFIYREEEMGYDLQLIRDFGADKGVVIDLTVAHSLPSMIAMLDSGLVDLVAYEVPVTAEFKQSVIACGPQTVTHQVLVQPKKKGKPEITDETQLVGKDVYVEADSKYQYRMQNLSDELGGGINLHVIDRDTLITEDLIDMVSQGKIPLTVVDSDIAKLNATYYKDLDVSLRVSFPQKASWGVAPGNQWLADSVNAYFSQEAPRRKQAELLKRFFELSKGAPMDFKVDFRSGHLSPYDHLFRRHAEEIGWDWRILAGQGYQESRFDSARVSWAGAKGVMQIMPRTARAYGLPDDKITNPEANIAAASRIVADLDKTFRRRVPDRGERQKFVLAAYNSGLAHILDAIALAEKYGLNPRVWDGNVARALMMKSNPEYYSDEVCRAGYFRGRETVAYVNQVLSFYNQAKRHKAA